MQEKGFIQVYTGDGKGKTTASLGLAMRALGHNWKVLVVQFTKGDSATNYGEISSSSLFSNLEVVQCGVDRVVYSHNIQEEDFREAQKGWVIAKDAILNKRYELVILDELNVAIAMNLVALEDVIDVLKNKPEELEVVLTGRSAHEEVIKLAHLVTEMRPVKHYFDDLGVMAREGIEF